MKIINKFSLAFFFVLFLFSSIAFSQEIEIMIPDDHLDGDALGVVDDWKKSGTNVFPLDSVMQLDVRDYGIYPYMQPVGQKIMNLIDSIAPSPTDSAVMLYFPSGAYLIERLLNIPSYVILKGAGGDEQLPEQTHFHFQLGCDYQFGYCITMSGKESGFEDIYITDETAYYPPLHPEQIEYPESSTNGSFSIGCPGNVTYAHSVISQNDTVICSIDANTIVMGWAYFHCDLLEPNTMYSVVTEFASPCDTLFSELYFILNKNGGKSLTSQSFINGRAKTKTLDSVKTKTSYYRNTIKLAGSNNWVKGVESYNSRRFHVLCNGVNNTISGCYFHHSHSYSDKGGRGYGVDIKGDHDYNQAMYNRVEDNVFNHLRHAMVLEGDAERNVVAYNFSTDVHWSGGNPLKKATDLLLHGRPNDTYNHGPKTNLLEGNYVVRTRIDWVDENTKLPNGPFNTYLRNHTRLESQNGFFHLESVDEEYKSGQYAQNIIGCNMKKKSQNTWDRLQEEDENEKQYSFLYKYNEDSGNYGELEDKYDSFYNISKPDFYPSWITYPYTPWDNKIIPAKYRWDSNNGYYTPVPMAINQGWDDYTGLCAPPKLLFVGETIEGETEEYKAMQSVLIENTTIESNNDLVFHAGEDIFLLPNTIIEEGSEVIIEAGNVCDGKGNHKSKYDIYTNEKDISNYLNMVKNTSEELLNTSLSMGNSNENRNLEVFLFPNPNNGEFTVQSKIIYTSKQIQLYGTMGERILFSIDKNKIKLKVQYKGMILLRLFEENTTEVYKVIIQ